MDAFIIALGISIKIAILAGIITYAIKLLRAVTEIAKSQKAIANSQMELIDLLSRQNAPHKPVDGE